MKLTILGNNGSYPSFGGACSGYLLSSDSGKTNILIDCGSGVLANLSQILPCSALDAVILSHLHYDHMSDLLPMQYALEMNSNPVVLPLLAPETPAPVRDLLNVSVYSLRPMEDCSIGELQFRFFPVRHPVTCYALRAECDGRSFVYTGDTNEVEGLDHFAQGADLMLIDAAFWAADWNMKLPHLSVEGAIRLAGSAGCDRVLLTHPSPRYTIDQLESEARAIRPDAAYCRIGAEYEI